uniref:Uncharacterized protein n=1 Tax=Brassica campestris TaxID=3711 RepID=A5JVC0_BRACM|nr:hypothetical protein [Brassica rapa]
MAEETVRIRLVFENQRILSKHQKKQGLKRSWAVLNPKYHRTVSEFSNHILYTFSLFEACPHGLSLYMDGFVLPPFESSCVLKDKDIVCVKRKKEPLLEIVGEDSEENVCAAIEIEERRARICPDAVLIGNEETGGYESESEEEEEIVPEKKTSKKRPRFKKRAMSPDELCIMSAETKKLQQNQMQMVVAPSKKPAITIDHQETEENRSEALEKQQPDEQGDGVRDEVVVPVEESFLWNGNMTKKKGQKWGTEKTGFSKRYAWDLNDTYHQTQPAEAETLANGQIDYEQLVAYTGSVKKGDIIAYRLIELTSSWTPEVSSFRVKFLTLLFEPVDQSKYLSRLRYVHLLVGKISYYDPVSKMVTLMPVQGYPIEKKIEEDDDSSMQADTSLYNEDGSLEVEFSSLLDVRSVKTSSSDVVEVATKPDQAATNLKLSTNSNGLQTTVKENGKGNPWEELSEAVSAKKAKLSEANNGWNKKGKSSSGGSWRRGGGIGPLMNYLRSQKEI